MRHRSKMTVSCASLNSTERNAFKSEPQALNLNPERFCWIRVEDVLMNLAGLRIWELTDLREAL